MEKPQNTSRKLKEADNVIHLMKLSKKASDEQENMSEKEKKESAQAQEQQQRGKEKEGREGPCRGTGSADQGDGPSGESSGCA